MKNNQDFRIFQTVLMSCICVIMGLIVCPKAVCQNVQIKVVTEEFPLYNYTENKKITGVSTEIVQAVFTQLGLECNIKVYPWARAYSMAQNDPNTLIYSIGRIKQRENMFKWVGIVAPYDVYFFGLSDRKDISIQSLNDARKYIIGTTFNDAREQFLIDKGFILGKHLHSASKIDLLFKMLFAKRIDILPYPELVLPHMLKKLGYDGSLVRKIYKIKDISSDGLYMAFSLKTSDQVVGRFKQALKKIKDNGTYQKIQNKYIGFH